ncbi:hypothetical protein ONE63_010872 [Megalurothrips usitatus]|uniref:Myb-like domain-containing protein n=1 Tax=Megalurothrips usitatus TaxID=439358 RepID=A0AAV7XEB4_9NEOP|nr:hypothetical protein ONE63_010872 [Megalurothrips usitatus]
MREVNIHEFSSAKLKAQTEMLSEEVSSTQNVTPVLPDMVAGMNSLEAALRKVEKCMAGSSQPDTPLDDALDHGVEANVDDVPDGEDEGVSSSCAVSHQQTPGSIRSAHPRGRNRVLKKRNQLRKDLEHALPLAASDQSLLNDERSHAYASSFFLKVKERYETQNSNIFPKFMEIFHQFGNSYCSVTDLYHRVINLLEGDPDLCEEFLLFLLPKQALKCGKFMEHLALTEMSSFLRKLELQFAKQPQQLKKILATWARLAENPDVSLEAVRSSILPLLRGNSFLVDSFIELLPPEKPPESKMTDFDHVVCEEMDGEHSGEEETFERLEIPPEIDDPYGGENCQCCCHSTSSDPGALNRTKHCTPCGIKFISGKVFMQTEHGLRPARIEFSGNGSLSCNLKRLNVDHQKLSRPRSRRGRTNTSQGAVKVEEGKHSMETDDEAVFTSKIKSPRLRPKISKANREKPSTARSLPMNQASYSCRASAINLNSPPLSLTHDQVPPPTSSPNTDEKLPALDFADLSNVLKKDQDDTEKRRRLSGDDAKDNLADQPLNAGIKEECRIEDEMNGSNERGNRSIDTDKKLEFIEDELKDEDCASDDVSMEEMDQRADDFEEEDDDDVASNMDVSGASSECDMEEPSEIKEGPTWTREEDRIILCTFQSEPDKDKNFNKIRAQLPHRTVAEISSRFQLLMNLIQQMRS